MPNYNLSYMDYQPSFVGLVEGLNTATNEWFFGLVLLVAWIVTLLVLFNKTDTSNLLIGTGFIFSILGGLSFAVGLIPVWAVVFPATALMGGLLFKYMGGS